LSLGYRRERAFWEGVLTLRKFFQAAVIILTSSSAPGVQNICLLWYIFISIVVHVWADPYLTRSATNAEMFTLVCLFLTVLLIELGPKLGVVPYWILMGFVTFLVAVVIIYLVIMILRNHAAIAAAKDKRAELRRIAEEEANDYTTDSGEIG